MTSIVIPAHNEDKVIGATLAELLPGVVDGEIEVVVVCNGCSDNTARVVASFGQVFTCIETSIPSKAKALNLGDAAAHWFPRIYQDADVILSLDAVRKISNVLQKGDFLAAAPKMRMDCSHASCVVRSYYEVWQQLPYVREGMIGTGVYALSKEGQQRLGKFPQIIADDGYVRALFKTHERTSVDDCYSVVRAPVNLGGLLKIKTRSRLGGYELAANFPELLNNEEKRYGMALFDVLGKVTLWPQIPMYLYVTLVSRLRAKKHARNADFSGWERDESSRNVVKQDD